MRTLQEVILAQKNEELKGITFIDALKNQTIFKSYHQIYEEAKIIQNNLYFLGLRKGDYLIVELIEDEMILRIFWGCILAGIIPVPLAYGTNHESVKRLSNVAKCLKKSWLVTEDVFLAILPENILPTNYIIKCDDLLRKEKEENSQVVCNVSENELALIQFSSGSTGDPKGIMLTHKNILSTLQDIKIGLDVRNEDSVLSWLPLTHDFGMIGIHLSSFFNNLNLVLLSTNSFIFNPSTWLSYLTKYQTTITASPNFGYQHLVNYLEKKTNYDDQNWDLHAVREIINGAEPIAISIIDRFEDKLRSWGLSRNTVLPVYGLAEASLAVSFHPLRKKINLLTIDRRKIKIGNDICEIGDDSSSPFTSVGRPAESISVRICDEAFNTLEDGKIGLICINGLSITQGYINNSDSENIFFDNHEWFNTNDLGVMKNGEIFILGRAKDIIFINGKNFFAADLENLIRDQFHLSTLIFAQSDETNKQDQVFLFGLKLEFEEKKQGVLENELKKLLIRETGVTIDRIILLNEFPLTTSGKVERYKVKKLIE